MFPAPLPIRPHAFKLMAMGLAVLSLGMLASGSVQAQAVANCSSDGRKPPGLLVERFMSAECTTCWSETTLPRSPRGAATLDWVAPSAIDEDAPMAAVARPESFFAMLAAQGITAAATQALPDHYDFSSWERNTDKR